MPSQEDLLFCKIAVMNGLVSETNAKKVLALVDKKEKDNGRRPFIGAVFTKYNLMRTPDVEKVLDAVRKRSGGGASSGVSKSSVRRPSTKSGRARPRGQTTRVESKAVKPTKRMDPATMWIGIGALLVCVGIIFAIVYLVVSGGGHGKPETAKGGASSKAAAEDIAANLKKLTESPKGAGAPAAPVEQKPLVKGELPELVKLEVASLIADAMSIEPAQGLALLEGKKKELEEKNYLIPQTLEDAIKNRSEAAGTPVEAPPPPAAAPDAKAAQAVAPAPPADAPPAGGTSP